MLENKLVLILWPFYLIGWGKETRWACGLKLWSLESEILWEAGVDGDFEVLN